MDTNISTTTRSRKHHSELDRFKLFYEFATPTKDVIGRNKSQSANK